MFDQTFKYLRCQTPWVWTSTQNVCDCIGIIVSTVNQLCDGRQKLLFPVWMLPVECYTTSRGPHKHADGVLHCVLPSRWCPCLRWSCCRGSTWERLRKSGRLAHPTQMERRCRQTEKATLNHGSFYQKYWWITEVLFIPGIIMKDIVSGFVYMMHKAA